MKVLMLTDKLTHGGAENYFCKLENGLQDSSLTLFSAASTGDLQKNIKNVQHFIELSRTNHFLNLLRLRKFIRRQRIDIIHANSLRMVLYAVLLKKITKRHSFKIIYTKHNVTALEKYKRLFTWVMNHYVSKVITVSDYEKNVLVKYGVNIKKITTVYNGVDVKKFSFSQKDVKMNRKIGILARLSEEKNHDLFLEVASILRNHANLTFYIGGDGPEDKSIRGKIAEMALEDKVMMEGAISEPEKFIKNMDVLVLTSKREVFPMVVLEAMAVGTPLVTIDKGGIKEAVSHMETGMLIPSPSPAQFADAILNVIEDRAFSQSLLQRARKKVVSEFSEAKMLQRTLEQYFSVYQSQESLSKRIS